MISKIKIISKYIIVATYLFCFLACNKASEKNKSDRIKISINDNWQYMKYATMAEADSLIYDIRPKVEKYNDNVDADTKPTEAVLIEAKNNVLKPYILPTGNEFIKDTSKHYTRPKGNPGKTFPFVQVNFDDSNWKKLNLPHDWAIDGPFLEGWDTEVGGGMARLPSHGVAWYRKKINIPKEDKDKSIFLDVDGAMSYAMVWLNGNLVGGWPYGYNSWRLNLTPYIKSGEVNQLAIRVDNPPKSSRWYPGAGIYRNVWLVKTNKIHVSHWGSFVKTKDISNKKATIDLDLNLDNDLKEDKEIVVKSRLFEIDADGNRLPNLISEFPEKKLKLKAQSKSKVLSSVKIKNPKLWGPPPSQNPNLYEAVTTIILDGEVIDEYTTKFGIRSIKFDPNSGIVVNGEPTKIKGVNQHHDLGALGTAFNVRAAERQLEILKELGCNAIRLAHNPPAPELLELTDRMGFLVIDEVFDVWERKKTPLDTHLIFPDWYEQDLRSFVRRDKNHPSVIMWSFGNEVGEQYTDKEGAKLGIKLAKIVKDEDPTRLTTASMNYAKAHMPFPKIMDAISLNYQGEGIRDAPAYKHMKGIKTKPSYPAFHKSQPNKVIISSESAAALSTRGTYIFPVFDGISAPVEKNSGGNPKKRYVSAYELYTTPFGSSADKVFATQDKNSYVAGEFVWSGWDYLGEPTPYYLSRSSYFGIIDLAGFKKDRFYLYQSRWRPNLPIAHILPHWNWPERIGKVTPVHVFTSGDEAELFLNGKSLGKKKKGPFEYRLRWDNVIYEPGEVKVVTYKEGKQWAEDLVKTTGKPSQLIAKADRNTIKNDGKDLSFITVSIVDKNGFTVPTANNKITFSIDGPGTIVATDNGDPTDMNEFSSKERNAFNGLALAIIQSKKGETGEIVVNIVSEGMEPVKVEIKIE